MNCSRTQGRRRARRAFTLVEIIVVVTIIAVIAALVAPRLLGRLDWAKGRTAKSDVSAIASVVTTYLLDAGEHLDPNFDLEVLLIPAEDGGGPQGPYLQKAENLVDPWGNPYVIRVPGEVNYDFDIVSLGADGQEGTEDDIVH
jgi:general secretion pathway protein G